MDDDNTSVTDALSNADSDIEDIPSMRQQITEVLAGDRKMTTELAKKFAEEVERRAAKNQAGNATYIVHVVPGAPHVIKLNRSNKQVRSDFQQLRDRKRSDFVNEVDWKSRHEGEEFPNQKPLVFETLPCGQLLAEMFNYKHRASMRNQHNESANTVLEIWREDPSQMHKAVFRLLKNKGDKTCDDLLEAIKGRSMPQLIYNALQRNSSL